MAENNSNLFFHSLGSQEPEVKAKGVLRGNVARRSCAPHPVLVAASALWLVAVSLGGCFCRLTHLKESSSLLLKLHLSLPEGLPR